MLSVRERGQRRRVVGDEATEAPHGGLVLVEREGRERLLVKVRKQAAVARGHDERSAAAFALACRRRQPVARREVRLARGRILHTRIGRTAGARFARAGAAARATSSACPSTAPGRERGPEGE